MPENKCPNCASTQFLETGECEFCHVITHFDQEEARNMTTQQLDANAKLFREAIARNPGNTEIAAKSNFALGLCFMNKRIFPQALEKFKKAMEDDTENPNTYFYAALCLLNGKKPFLCDRNTINEIITYVNSAIGIEGSGIYYYFLAYIKQDYFARKCFKVTPDWTQELKTARTYGYSIADANDIFRLIGVAKPDNL